MLKNKKYYLPFVLLFISLLFFSCFKKKTETSINKLKTNISADELIFTLENEIPKTVSTVCFTFRTDTN